MWWSNSDFEQKLTTKLTTIWSGLKCGFLGGMSTVLVYMLGHLILALKEG